MAVNITQLTNNSISDNTPDISGNSVTWYTEEEGEIYYYNNGIIQKLTDNSIYDEYPTISGNNIVWSGYDGQDNEIYYYNGSTVQQLTNNATDESPAISGNNIVWSGYDGQDNEIYYYNGSTVQQLTSNNTNDLSPVISGNNIVWSGYDGQDNEIYYYNGSTIQKLTNNTTNDLYAQISGNNIAWSGYNGQDYEIYYYNGSDIQQLTNNTTDDWYPQISGNNIAWMGYDGQDNEIYYYNGSNIQQLTNNNINDGPPQISGNNIVWTAYIYGQDDEIYYYNGSTVQQLTNNTTDDDYPQISGNNIVWEHDDGQDTEIYLAEITSNKHPTNINLNRNTVAENRPKNVSVGTMTTVDPDSGQTHSYSLVSGEGDTDNSAFRIVNNQLRTNQVFDYESQNSYSIRVRTTDNQNGTYEKIFTINVTDLADNNPSTDILLSRNTVPENRSINALVGIFRSVDPDGIQAHTYSLVSGDGDTNNSAFLIVNNQLRTNQRFDFETKDSYSIRVRTTDNQGSSFEKAFAINIIDVAEATSFGDLNLGVIS